MTFTELTSTSSSSITSSAENKLPFMHTVSSLINLMLAGRKPAFEIPCLDLEPEKPVSHTFGTEDEANIRLPDKWEGKIISKYVTDLQQS